MSAARPHRPALFAALAVGGMVVFGLLSGCREAPARVGKGEAAGPVLSVTETRREITSYLDLPIHYYPPEHRGVPTVVVIHDWGGSLRDWTDIAERLQSSGFGVVLFSLSGHRGDGTAYYYFDSDKIRSLRDDVDKAVEFARRSGEGEVYLLGAGMGANLALLHALEDKGIGRVVAVSPGLDYRGLALGDLPEKLDPERIMFIASQEDVYSLYTINSLARRFLQQPRVRLYENVGHGVWVLKRSPSALESVVSWLGSS